MTKPALKCVPSRGQLGEEMVKAHYEERGWVLLAQNWRCSAGELDLVVSKVHTVVFCEVKSRSSSKFGSPAEAVTSSKIKRIRKASVAWLAENGGAWRHLRFDVAEVRLAAKSSTDARMVGRPEIVIIEGAF